MLLPATASAQNAEPADKSDNEATVDQIIVTGTLIRGIAPVGSDIIDISADKIEATGGKTTNQILNSLPQVGNFFNALPVGISAVSGSNASNPISRPNLRNLPAANTSGGAQTLVLLDGHRLVGAGIAQVAVDPDIIAPGVIERVEALTDGGSAVYGSDALGGVINFIPRKRFDGAEATARYGIGDSYHSFNASAIVGKAWDSGSAYVAYGFAKSDAVYGSDRGFVKKINWDTGVPTGRNCADPNITANGNSYVVSGSTLAAGGPNACDPSDYSSIYPDLKTHNVFARLNQDLTDSIHFDVTALYAIRKVVMTGGVLGGVVDGRDPATVTIASSYPFYRDTGGADSGASQTIAFNYGPVAGYHSNLQHTSLESWDITPSLAFDLGSNWQIRTLANYGESKTAFHNNVINPGAQAAALAAGTLNPYNIAATSQGVLSSILDGIARGDGRDKYSDFRAIADGSLIQLPGGDVHVAVGAEYMRTKFKVRQTNANLILSDYNKYTQSVKSAFGEIVIPVFGTDNGFTGMQELIVSASGRYDKYNDFGDTFNPKLGVTYKPIEWITFRGSWGKSFNAPSPTDQLGPATAGAFPVPSAYLQWPSSCGGTAATCSVAGAEGVFLGSGALNGLTPQKATSWSIGAEVEPPFVDGLKLSLSYYNIDLKGTIGRPVTSANLNTFYASFPNLAILNPTGKQLADYLAASLQNQSNISFAILNPTDNVNPAMFNYGAGPRTVGLILDTLIRNLGETKIEGLDFAVNYSHSTSFGSIDGSFGGNYRLSQKSQISPLAPVIDDLAFDISKFLFSATLGADIGNLRAQATLNHTSGYSRGDAGAPDAFGQTKIKAFNVVNLFFKYDMNGSGISEDLAFTLNVDNVFNVAPPLFKSAVQSGYDPSHTLTLGRVFQLGVQKKF